MMSSENMSLMGWRTLAEWSISYSCVDAATKEKLLSDYGQRWTEFCEWIVEVYGKA